VTSVEGDATVATSRGQKKYIYDLTVSLDWKLQLGSVLSVSGTARVSDITADNDFEVRKTVV
jgi:activator of HSP90 ATPase